MRIGSLCSGYEGLGMAVQTLVPDAELAWVSDVDKGANKILAHRYPDVPNLGDFTVMDWSTVEPIDMLTAGYPCQPFSHAGKREGTNDARHLWPEVLRCLTELRPPFALFENVRGHLSLGFDQVLADLATHDYDARWIVLRAADIGAPHGRARLFILASDARRSGDRWDLVGAGRGAVRVSGVRGEDPDSGADEGGADLLGRLSPFPCECGTEKSCTVDHALGDHCPTCGCAEGYHDADGFCAGPCGGAPDCGGRGVALLPTPRATRGGSATETTRMLPTPTSRDWKDHTIRREPHRPDDTDTLARALTDVPCALLPTPAVNDMGAAYTPETWDAWTEKMKAEHGNGNGHGKSLSIEAQRLLPTPKAADGEWGLPRTSGRPPEMATHLATAVEFNITQNAAQWGDYAPAIHRWEQILGRRAPAPTVISEGWKKARERRFSGNHPARIGFRGSVRQFIKPTHQLSPRFVEWMMGLPEGWVDDVPGLTRNEKLKALGNGVVSQQAVEAVLRLLALGERVAA